MMNRKIPKGWRETTLGEIAEIIMGQSPKSESYNLIGDGIPFYQGVTEFNDKYVSIKTYTNQPKKIIEGGSILFSVRAPVGRVNFTKHKACIGRGNAGFNIKNGSQEFLYYLLINIENYIQSHSSGTVFSSISGKELKAIKVVIPECYEEQVVIGQVLSSLDEKIELLEEENKTLEKLAQTIFTEWFVNFNFPGCMDEQCSESGTTSPDETSEMVNSEMGEIPKGWRVGKLGELTNIKGGSTPSTKNESFWNGDLSWTSPKDLSNSKSLYLLDTEKKITEEGLKKISSGLLPIGTLLMSSRAPIGYLAISNIEVAINQGYIAFLEGAYFSNIYMYLWLKINMQLIISSANGSTFLEISKGSFKNIETIIPSKEIMMEFENIIKPMFNKILNNLKQIETLKTTRDTLLFELTTGEIRVEGYGE